MRRRGPRHRAHAAMRRRSSSIPRPWRPTPLQRARARPRRRERRAPAGRGSGQADRRRREVAAARRDEQRLSASDHRPRGLAVHRDRRSRWRSRCPISALWILAIARMARGRVHRSVLPRSAARRARSRPNAVLSPADGKVVSVERARDPYLDRDALKISVFMNVFNVHSNRSPVDGVVRNSGITPAASSTRRWTRRRSRTSATRCTSSPQPASTSPACRSPA